MGSSNTNNNRNAITERRKIMCENLRETYVRIFQKAMEQAINVPYETKTLYLRQCLIAEEYKELSAEIHDAIAELEHGGAVSQSTKENILKELCDLLYVISGFAVTFGLPLQPAFNRVHESNMSKLENGKPLKDDWGKVQKSTNYKPPKLGDLV